MHPHPAFNIASVSNDIRTALQAKIDSKTKPLGALGQLERAALRIGLVQQTLSPALNRPAVLVFAGDHGIVAEGVSPYPQAVTYQMVLNFLAGGAAINVFARQHGMALRVVDAGVNGDFDPHPSLVGAKIGKGTRSFLSAPAMSREQCQQALEKGAALAKAEIAAGSNVLGFGEMGIGNTTSAAALMSIFCGLPPEQCVGRGTGLDDAGVQKKAAIVQQALALHGLDPSDPVGVLAAVGGFEIAMMAGAMLGAAESKALLLIDGFIASAALLTASRLAPEILDYCIFTHCSGEAGHTRLLNALGAEPLLDLGMRLGEGTGTAIAYPLVQSSVNFLNEMASFESAGVSERED
ncbi:nicotinate-nucleotide--dimethylbenzimidazole phosphoribosyltransferase [Novimethylophilus kurashikiensis]|uniref:Nicotinate-nucleotide--dimethylbenzimidazole phosphoribosyltransferase n=1 Tax=Novimethylophilus kurashikiensis TaxID=1825523 RepID=A0A2R5FB29_9PROT|nr:nicotinate-nucleotide--dimethylbenzimidazole phosphoribosyltransferase [Novimethylophilus kurashikiensis]GBG13834.1 nicotinate-nucleotide--dimethylbenzimidazole phosphoribosyltransferase [Novimethylophilus kurashikiensis]